MRVLIVSEPFEPQEQVAAFAAGRTDVGALVSFVGLCRAATDDADVHELRIDQYPDFTHKEIVRLAREVGERCDCPDLLVVHRVGLIVPGEAIVLVAGLSVHRANAFQAVCMLMDYLKTDAPLWKQEVGSQGSRWIESRDTDRARRAALEGELA